MIKQIAAISALTLSLTGCVSPVRAEAAIKVNTVSNITLKPEDVMKSILLRSNTYEINSMIKNLKKYVGKTWYVFSGNTPSGWDCSGLTMWAYSQIGIELEHRASKQASAGKSYKEPKIGDIVAFSYKGYKSAYHVGIYIGNGMMIHAPKKGHLTRIESVDQFAGNYSNIQYIRIIDTL